MLSLICTLLLDHVFAEVFILPHPGMILFYLATPYFTGGVLHDIGKCITVNGQMLIHIETIINARCHYYNFITSC